MIENIISKRYAEALSASIDDEGLLHRALGNLKAFREAFDADRQLGRFFFTSGDFGRKEKHAGAGAVRPVAGRKRSPQPVDDVDPTAENSFFKKHRRLF